jgi:NADH dehydrogenase FAD-containing subunit
MQGIALKSNTTVQEVTDRGLHLIDETGSGYFFPSDLTLFTAGTIQSGLIKKLDLQKDSNGRILVESTLQIPGHDRVFALGDCCAIDGDIAPATAQVALQQSGTLARNLLCVMNPQAPPQSPSENSKLEQFKYVSLGEMLSLGDTDAAITSLGGLVGLKGPLAALTRRAIYAVRMPTTTQAVKALITASAVTTGKLLARMFGSKHE